MAELQDKLQDIFIVYTKFDSSSSYHLRDIAVHTDAQMQKQANLALWTGRCLNSVCYTHIFVYNNVPAQRNESAVLSQLRRRVFCALYCLWPVKSYALD